MWLVLGGVTIVAALQAERSARAQYVGRAALGVLFIGIGATVHAVYLATGADDSSFADGSQIPFVRDTWRSLVAPNQGFFIPLLIVFEATAGILVLTGGLRTQAALVALMGFHAGVAACTFWLRLWSVPMLFALARLLRAERRLAAGLEPTQPIPPIVADARTRTPA